LPALTTLRRHLPDASIDWVVEEAGAEILEGHPALDRCLVLPRRTWRAHWRERRWVGLVSDWLRYVRGFRGHRYDLVIDFQGLAKSAVWVALARSGRKAGFGRGTPRNEGAWLALNERVPPVSPDRHALERGLDLLEALGFSRLPVRYDVPLDADTSAEADRLLVESGLGQDTSFVAINPVTRWPTKDWEATRFAAVADGLIRAGVRVVFTGGPADGAEIDAIVGAMAMPSGMVRVDGRTRLRVLAAVYRRARVVVSTDTGPMHVAVAVGTPVVALFGPTAPWRTGPHGEGNVVLRVGLDCSPCYKRRCQTTAYESRACMLRLEPGAVVDAVTRIWGASRAPAGGG
jgi:lipopolysaccharide heptosyltransferase I